MTERPVTLAEFRAAKAAAEAAADPFPNGIPPEDQLFTDEQYAVYLGLAQIVEWELYDDVIDYANVAHQTTARVGILTQAGDIADAMGARYLAEHTSS
jgi:hypothetical protein